MQRRVKDIEKSPSQHGAPPYILFDGNPLAPIAHILYSLPSSLYPDPLEGLRLASLE